MTNPLRTIRAASRLNHIGSRAVRHGLGLFVDQIGIYRRRGDERAGQEAPLPPLGRRVRMLLQDLGPTFIKLGQVASSRGDLLPDDVVSELRKLQDEVPPAPSERVLAVIDAEFDKPRDTMFDQLNETPIAAASIAQVYAAKTKADDDVIVKVQRPGIERTINVDIETLRVLAEQVEARIPITRRYSPAAFVEEFAEIITEELVFTHEAHNCEFMASHYEDDQRVHFPKVYWDLTSRRVLTLERLHGIRIKDVDELRRAGHDTKALATGLATHILEQIFLLGFVHGDPHGGNVLVLPDGRLGFLDFGIVCRLDPGLRENLVRLFSAIFAQDSEDVVDVLFSVGAVPDRVNPDHLRREIQKLLARYYFAPRSEMGIGQLANKLMTIVFHHGIRVPAEMSLLAKVLLITEGTCLALDPEFDFNETARPLAREMHQGPFTVANATSALRSLASVNRYIFGLPRQLSRILNRAQRGGLTLQLESRSTDRSLSLLAHGLNRLALSILLAGISIASSLLISTQMRPMLWGYPALGLLGLAVSAILAVAVILAMVRRPPPDE